MPRLTQRFAPAMLVLAVMAGLPAILAAQEDGFTVQELLDVASVRLLDLSPDGRWAAVSEASQRDRLGTDNHRYGDPTYVSPARDRVRVVDTRTGEATPVFDGPAKVDGAAWSPDGRRLALMEHRDGAWRAVVWDRTTGRLEPVSLPGNRAAAGDGPIGLAWSPDGAALYVPARSPGWADDTHAEFRRLTEGPVVVQSSDEDFLAWEALRRRAALQSLWVVPAAGGEAREVLGERMLRDVAVLPGGRIRYDADITGKTSYERIFGTVETVKVLDPRTGAERTVIASTDSIRPTWSEDGAHYAFTRDGAVMMGSVDGGEPSRVAPAPASDSAGGGDWSLVSVAPGGGHVLARRRGDLYHLRVEGGDPLRVLDLPDPDDEDARAPEVRVVRWTGDAAAVFLTRESRTEWRRALLRYDVDTRRVDVIASTDRLLGSMTLSDDGSTMVYASAPGNRPMDLWASSPTLGDPRRLTDANPDLDASDLGSSELFSYMDVDGRTLYGVVYYPPDYVPGRRYPTVFNVYEEFFDDGFNGTNAFLASRGYVVVRPSVHLERGYPGEAWLKGVTAAANELIRRGVADPDRLGVHGTSYGGYAVNLLVTQTDRFAAAVNISGKVDMISFYTDSPRLGVRNIHAPENSQDRIGATLWEQPQKYVAHSAIMAADRIDTPLLLVTGQQDHNVPERTTMEMFYALRRLGKTVEWVSYVDGGHGMPTTDAAMVEDYHRRLVGWYDRWLKADGAVVTEGVACCDSVPEMGSGPPPAIEVVGLTAEQVQADYAAGRYTAVELTRVFLDRIDRYDGRYNAFISMNPDALSEAAALDREYAERGPRGPLHGVPVVVKDNMDMAGLVTTAGYEGFSAAAGGIDMIPDDDAAVVTRLRGAGAIILGKTNLPDFAGDGTRTKSSAAGVTLNAYDVTRAPGGSSGGTATAVAASFAVLGLGTETGGSIQNPAAAQGLVGMKPTFGLVPIEGILPIDATYRDVAGPLTKTVRDAAVALDVLAGPTPEDFATYAAVGKIPEEGYAAALDADALRGKRFGLVGTGWRERWLPLAPETEALYRKAIGVLEAQGADVVEDPFLGSGWRELYEASSRVPSVGSHDLAVYLQGLGPGAAFHSVEEWEALTGRRFRDRGDEREPTPPARPSATEEADAFQAWRKEMRSLFRKVLEENELDALFFPQAGAPIRDLVEDPERPDYSPNNHPELPSNIINDLGLPVVTVPYSLYEDGTPFVIAFIGDLWTEADLLAWAYAFEQATHGRVEPALAAEATP